MDCCQAYNLYHPAYGLSGGHRSIIALIVPLPDEQFMMNAKVPFQALGPVQCLCVIALQFAMLCAKQKITKIKTAFRSKNAT